MAKNKATTKRYPTFTKLLFGLLAVVIVIAVWQFSREFFQEKTQPIQSTIKLPPPQAANKQPPSPKEVAKPHLDWAEQECKRIINEHLKDIYIFFEDSKKKTPEFAEEALSFGSKWRLMVDYVPYTSGGKHERFIRGKFEEYIFKLSQLKHVVEQVVASYLEHVKSIEGQMLVRIQADVADFPTTFPNFQVDEKKLKGLYGQALKRAMEATGIDLGKDIAIELVSQIAGQVLTQVAVKLGVSAGVLGTGAASSWATVGIGVIVALIVDQIISWIWDWYADPKGDLAGQINRKLDDINRLIVEGSGGNQGLRERLHQLSRERARVRKQAVFSLLQSE